MNNYKSYLQKQDYSTSSIVSYINEIQHFKKWCKRNNTTPIEIDYKTSLKYIKYLTKKGNCKKTINPGISLLKFWLFKR